MASGILFFKDTVWIRSVMTIHTANFAKEIHFANSDAVPSPQICPNLVRPDQKSKPAILESEFV